MADQKNSFELSQDIIKLRETIAEQDQKNAGQTYDPKTNTVTTKPSWHINLPRPQQTFINPEMANQYPRPEHDQGPWNAPVTVEQATPKTYWNDARRIGRYYYALQSLPPGAEPPAWLDKPGIEAAYKYLEETRPGQHWTTWDQISDDDPVNIVTQFLPTPPINMIPNWERQGLASQYEYEKKYNAWKYGEDYEEQGYTPDPSVRETDAIGIAQETWDQLPEWKKAANKILPVIQTGMPGLGGAIIGGTIAGPLGAIAGSGLMIGGAKFAEKNPDSAISKIFLALNWPAEQVEKLGGLEAQIIYSLVDPEKYGELSELFGSWENFVATYKAGAVFYESIAAGQQIIDDRNVREELKTFDGTLNEYMSTWIDSGGKVEPNRVIVGHDITSTEDIVTEVPDQKLANAWIMQEARNRILKGESAKEVYFSLAQNFGFLGSMKELVGNVVLDPLDLIGPIGNVTLGKVGKATGNTAMVEAFGLKGDNLIQNTQMYKRLIRQMPPEQAAQLSAFDRWLGNITAEGLPKEYSNAPAKNPFNYLFGLTPKARANYLLSTFVDGLNNLIAHETDISKIEQMINKISSMSPMDAVKGADTPTMTLNIGGEDVAVNVPKWYMSAEAQMLPTAIKDASPVVKELLDAYRVAEPQRAIINRVAEYMGMTGEELVKKLHNATGNEANHLYTQFVLRLQKAAQAGDTGATKILDTLTKADEFKTLSGGKLKQMADEFTRKNGIPFNESIMKYKLLDAMEQQIGKWAVDWFGVKPDRLLFRMGNVVKRAQGALLLGLNPAYFFNNTIDNLVKMSWDGLIGLGKFTNNKLVLDNLGFTPTRYMQAAGAMDVGGIESGVLKMSGIDDKKTIGQNIRAAGRANDSVQKVDDLFKRGDKWQVAQQASQLMEKWSSQTAMVRGIQEYLNRSWQPGKGFDKISDDLRLILDAKEQGLAKKVERMIAKNYSKKAIEKAIFGDMQRHHSIRDVLDPDAADMLDHLGLIDEIDNGLKTAVTEDDIFNTFVNAIEKGQNRVAENIIRKMKKITADALMKTNIEGFQGVLDMLDNLEQMNADFWLKHMDAMQQVFEDASKRSGQFRSATWQTGRAEQSRNWNTQNNIYGAKVLGIFEGLGMDSASPEYLAVGKLIINKNNVWNDFFRLTDDLYTKFQDEVANVTDVERMTKWDELNYALNKEYLDAVLREDDVINQLNDAFIVQYAKQFENKGKLAILEARNWRSSIQTERRKMMQAQLLWRNGEIPEEALKWGDLLPQETKDAITKLNQGKPIHTFNRATRDKISPKFWNDIYRQFVKDMATTSTKNAPGMVRSGDLPADLQADLPEIPKVEPDTKPKRPPAVEKHEAEVWKVISEKKPELGGVDENGLLIPDAKLNIIKYVLKWSPEARGKARANADGKLHFTDIMPADIETAIALEADWIKRQMALPLDDPMRVIDEQGNVIKQKPEPTQVEDPIKAEVERGRRTEEPELIKSERQQEPVISESERIAQHIAEQERIRAEEIQQQESELSTRIAELDQQYANSNDTEIRAELRNEIAKLEKQRQDLINKRADGLSVESDQGTQTTYPFMPESRKVADIQDEFIRSAVETSLQQLLDDVGMVNIITPDHKRVTEAKGLGWYRKWYDSKSLPGKSKEAKAHNSKINYQTKSALNHLINGTDSKSEDILAYQHLLMNEAFAWTAQNDIYTAWKNGDYESAIRLYDQIADTYDDAAILNLIHGDENMLTQLNDAWIKSLEDNQVFDVADDWTTPTGTIEPAPRMTPEQQAMIDARRQYADVLDTYDMLRRNAEEMQRRLPPVKVGKETAERVLFDYLNDRGEPGQYEAVRTIWEGLANNYAKNNPGKTPEDWYETWVFNYGGDEIDISGLNQVNINNPFFQRWFGNSKVVDKNGQPLVLFHGTANDFEAFDPTKAGSVQYSDWGEGIYLTPRKLGADYYRVEAVKRSDPGYESAYQKFAELERNTETINGRPLYSEETTAALREFQQISSELDKTDQGQVLELYVKIENPYIQHNTSMPDPYLAEHAKSKGHDGIFVLNDDGSINEVVAFKPEQVKSVNNRGTFDPNDVRMLYQEAVATQKRGLTHWTDDGLAIMHVLDGGDISTIVHETIHIYTRQMGEQHGKVVTDWLRKEHKLTLDDDWYLNPTANRQASELLARGFEKYLADGKAPTPKLVQVFENFKRWMVEIYKSITGSDIDIKLNDDVKKVFDEWVSGEKVAEQTLSNFGQIKQGSTKAGNPVQIVPIVKRLEYEMFKQYRDLAKKYGGWYDKYNSSFTFRTEEGAQNFLKDFIGQAEETAEVIPVKESPKVDTTLAKQEKQANKLFDLADKLEENAQKVYSADRLENTARRARMGDSARASASQDIFIAKTMRNIAQSIADGEAVHLTGVTSKTHVQLLDSLLNQAKVARDRAANNQKNAYYSTETSYARNPTIEDLNHIEYPYLIIRGYFVRDMEKALKGKRGVKAELNRLNRFYDTDFARVYDHVYPEVIASYTKLKKLMGKEANYWSDGLETYNRIKKMGINNKAELVEAMKEFIAVLGEGIKPDKVKEMERALIGVDIPGYFPTPKELALQLVDDADIQPGMKVLEPSAGKGSIADAIKERVSDVDLEVIEYNYSLSQILKEKGYNVIGNDIFDATGKYDRIVMNPPFEKLQDIDHVMKAYELLEPGGRIVSIMGAGSFFRNDAKAVEFRDWLDTVGTYEPLPEGSFLKSDRSTGVNTYKVVIDKPVDITADIESIKPIAIEPSPEPMPTENVWNMEGVRARAGGEWGINGEWYNGGEFLPSSPNTIKGEFRNANAKKAKAYLERKQEVAPYTWETPPAIDQQPIRNRVTELAYWDKTGYSKETGWQGKLILRDNAREILEKIVKSNSSYIRDTKGINIDDELALVKSLVDRFNNGERWYTNEKLAHLPTDYVPETTPSGDITLTGKPRRTDLLGDDMPAWELQSQKAEVQQFKPKDESLQDPLFDTREQLPTIEGKKNIERIGNFDYFIRDGELYKAPAGSPTDTNGYPNGARWEAPGHLAEQRLQELRQATGGAEGTPLFGEQGTTAKEFNLEQNTKIVDELKQAILSGKKLQVRTYTNVTNLKSPDWIWVDKSGDVRIPYGRGKSVVLTIDQVDSLLQQAGIDFERKYYQYPKDTNALFQSAPSTPKETAAQGAPFGTADQIIEAPTDEMLYEGWMNEVEPTLRKAMNDLMNSKVPEKGSIADGLPPEGKKLLRQYVGKTVSDLSSTNMGAVKYAEARRKFSLLDYSARTGFDSVAGVFFPYQFWYTRSALNWITRLMADPKILADYLRLTQFAQEAEDREGFPTRLKGKVGISAPFLPDWMGDTIYIDPMRKIFNFQEMARPFIQLAEENNLVNQKTIGAIQRMLEDETITEEQAREAIETRKGDVWEQAEIEARAEAELEIRNPFDFAFALASPSLPLSIGYNFTKWGDKDRISQLPITRTIQGVTSMMGIGGPRGVNVEEPFRKGFGLPLVDRFEDYRVNRELSNMVAGGLIDSETAIMAMINRAGPEFEDAQRRVATQMNTKLFLSSVGLDFFPEGEEEMRAIQSEYYKAMEARYEQGDEEAFVKFWDEFPEYEARQAAVNDDPEEMLRHFLRSRIWQAWNDKNGYEKGQIVSAFGDIFENSFLNKETRNYDDISTETYAAWAKTLGANMPDQLTGTPEIPNASIPDEVNASLNTYLEQRDNEFPGISETLQELYALPEAQQQAFRNQHPEIEDYTSWRNRYIVNNPEVISYLVGESSDLYGLPEHIQLAVYNYRVEVEDNFPNIYDTQSAYFNIANTNAKRNYLKQHPELTAYWDYRREYAAAYPQAAPYILSEQSLAKSILGEDRYTGTTSNINQVQPVDRSQFDDALLRLLASYFYGGRPLTSGARAELTRLWEKEGKPLGSMENWLNSVVWPEIKN